MINSCYTCCWTLLIELTGTPISLDIFCPMEHMFGVKNTSLKHLLIRVKILYNGSSFSETWERFELFTLHAQKWHKLKHFNRRNEKKKRSFVSAALSFPPINNFHDTLQAEADGSNEYNDFQQGSLNTTKQLIRDLNNIDIAFLIGDICYGRPCNH